MGLALAKDVVSEVTARIRPPERISVVEAAKKYVKVRTASGAIEDWNPDMTPYMIKPMNLLKSREYDAVIFIGPAQSGKTQGLITGFTFYIIKCDPSADFMILQTTKGTARDFDTQVIKRAFRDNPELKKELAPGSKSDNTYDKVFRSGSILFQRWPSINELSGKPLKYMLLTDYDRMTQDVDGEGTPFALSQTRTLKFLSRGMTVVDTSPGFATHDPTWRPRDGREHEAPPCIGALSLFNMGTMDRYYVKCPECNEYFLPTWDESSLDFSYSKDMFGATNTDMTRPVSFVCSKSGCLIDISNKKEMNRTAIWVPQGCRIEGGEVVGEIRKTRIASFWFPGVFAAFSDPEVLAQKFLSGMREYDITGEEQNLKTCLNVDFAAPFLSRNSVSEVNAADYEKRAEDLPQRQIPPGVRFIFAAIDVQARGFVVQINGYGVGYERWVIDRFEILISDRTERAQPLPCDPAAYLEDWDLIKDKVMSLTYPLSDGSGRVMSLLRTGCDSNGKAGVTGRSYDFWRSLRKPKLHNQFRLFKGERPKAESIQATVKKTFPENTDKTKKKADGRGEVPLWLLNTTKLKDSVSNDLARKRVGRGYIHFPNWLNPSFYEELCVEVRDDNGWENPLNRPNESFDLVCYTDALLKIEMIEAKLVLIDWDKPPNWAAGWDDNNHVHQSVAAMKAAAIKLQATQQSSLFDTHTTHSIES